MLTAVARCFVSAAGYEDQCQDGWSQREAAGQPTEGGFLALAFEHAYLVLNSERVHRYTGESYITQACLHGPKLLLCHCFTPYVCALQPIAVPVVGTMPFMIFGADVTHPTSFNETDPSIAAVCASYDRTLGRYMSRVLKQVSCFGGWVGWG